MLLVKQSRWKLYHVVIVKHISVKIYCKMLLQMTLKPVEYKITNLQHYWVQVTPFFSAHHRLRCTTHRTLQIFTYESNIFEV